MTLLRRPTLLAGLLGAACGANGAKGETGGSGTSATGGTGGSSASSESPTSSTGSQGSSGTAGSASSAGSQGGSSGGSTGGGDPIPEWSVIHDGPATQDDGAAAVALTPEGDLVVAGYEFVVGEGRNAWLRKLSAADGAELWTVTSDRGAGMADELNDVAVAPDGQIFVAGTVGIGTDDTDAFVTAFDPAGAELWSRPWAGIGGGIDTVQGVAVAQDGTVWAAGTTWSVGDDYDGLVVHYDAAGTDLGYRTILGNGRDFFEGVVAIPSSSDVLVLGGQTALNGALDGWLVRLDAAGVDVWDRTFDGGTDQFDFFRGGAVESASTVVLVGSSDNPDTGEPDVWMAWHDLTTGDALDTATWTGMTDQLDEGEGVAATPDGTILFAGSTVRAAQGRNLLFGEFDATGTESWHGEVDGPAHLDDTARDIIAVGPSALVVVGTYAILGQSTNVWVARYPR